MYHSKLESSFNLPRIEALLNPAYGCLGTIRNKEGILFLGVTGTGKSTAINYLKGCNYEKARDPDTNKKMMLLKPGQTVFVEEGHGYSAETFYPEGVAWRDRVVFCDMPGFNGNRTTEQNICEGYLRQQAVRALSTVRAAVICFPWNSAEARALDIESLMATTQALFKEPNKVTPSLFFLITKASKTLTPMHIINTFKNLKKSAEAALKIIDDEAKKLIETIKSSSSSSTETSLTEDSTYQLATQFGQLISKDGGRVAKDRQNLQNKINFYQQVLDCQNGKRLFILHPDDNGVSRTVILKAFSEHLRIQPNIEKAIFRLANATNDAAISEFNTLIEDAAAAGCQLINQKNNLTQSIKQLISDLKVRETDTLPNLKTYLEKVRAAKTEEDLLQHGLVQVRQRMRSISSELNQKQALISSINQRLIRLNRDIETHDTDDPLLHLILERMFPQNKLVVGLTVFGVGLATAAILAGLAATGVWIVGAVGTSSVAATGAVSATGAAAVEAAAGAAGSIGATAAATTAGAVGGVAAGAGAGTAAATTAGAVGGVAAGAGAGTVATAATLLSFTNILSRLLAAGSTLSVTAATSLLIFIAKHLEQHQFEYDATTTPYSKVEFSANHGWFISPKSEPQEYSITFIANPYFDSTASVHIYVATRQRYENSLLLWAQEKIVNEQQLTDLEQTSSNLQAELHTAQQEQQRITSRLAEINILGNDEGICDANALIERIQSNIQTTQNQITQINQRLESRKAKRNNIEQQLASMARIARFLYILNDVNPFEREITQEFLERYRKSCALNTQNRIGTVDDYGKIHGLKYKKIPDITDSLYCAVSRYIGLPESRLRQMVIDYLTSNTAQLSSDTDLLKGQSIVEYIESIQLQYEQSNSLDLAILMKALQRPIAIVDTNGMLVHPELIENQTGMPIFICDDEGIHCGILLPTGEKDLLDILAELKSKKIEPSLRGSNSRFFELTSSLSLSSDSSTSSPSTPIVTPTFQTTQGTKI